jgi:tRNA(Leu) C34 or U34 (ribose-2'-O)-methylase TrmL
MATAAAGFGLGVAATLIVRSLLERRMTPQNTAAASASPHPWHLIYYNVSKRSNLGTMLRSCAAFRCKSVFVVGNRRKKLAWFGSKGTKSHVEIEYFDTLEQCRAHCVERGIQIMGVEIDAAAERVDHHPFSGPTAFLMGNEGSGLSEREKEICDAFVYIPHFGNGTHSLNVTVAASIVFHRFATWAGYKVRPIEGAKFVIDHKAKPSGPSTEYQKQLSAARKAKRAAAVAAGAAATATACRVGAAAAVATACSGNGESTPLRGVPAAQVR